MVSRINHGGEDVTAPAFTREWSLMTAEQREQFERDGYLVVPDVLTTTEVAFYAEVLDRAHARAAAQGGLREDGSLHQLSAVTACPELAGLIDHRRTFPLVWSTLGWNVHIYHSHLDVHPHLRQRKAFWWHWHQDGGRQNRELETDPRPRMSVKVAFWLSDVSVTGRGNLTVIPGSHTANWLPGPPRRDQVWPAPDGAVEVTARPGDAVFFDRRIWHSRSDNYSPITRKVVFFGYTYRWVTIRDEVADLPARVWWPSLSPVQRQLLGAGDGTGDDQWGHYPESTALYVELRERGLLDPNSPPLIP
jgi:ectoine hydroxylase-related dioxygenase (phytanoyl-CoA dioxygenase family)